ncbi:MAG: hypothetical protein II826_02255 [Prevotella sp.]|nr:hypothetical protein [Prevotella sp.]
MSNICFTTYKVIGSKNSVAKLYEIIKTLDSRKTPLLENNWYNPKLWLGCLVKELGGKPDKVYCRGTITYYEMDNNVLTINTETAWREMRETRYFIEACFPGLKIYYRAEEEGEEQFYTNDVCGLFFKERFYLEGIDVNKYFESIIEVAEYARQIVGHKVEADYNIISNALTTYVKEYETEDETYYHLHKFNVLKD